MRNVANAFKTALLIALISTTAVGQKTWTGGGGDGQWSTASNWSGGTVPTSSDQALLDNSTVSGSYTVTLPTGATSVALVRLTITPSTGNTITLVLPSGNTSTQGLFVGDNTSNTDDIILNDGAILQNSSGAASGTPITVNGTGNGTFRINNGGKYLHNNIRGATTGLADRLSTASGTERGIFELDVPGTASFSPSGSGRTYGILILTRSGGAATYSVSGSNALTIKSHFILNSGVTFSSTMTGALNIGGDLTNNGVALSLPSGQAVVFNGSGTQTISGTGSITFGEGATVNNGSTVVLSRTISVSMTKTFTANGILSCGTNAVTGAGAFTLASGATLGIGSVDGITSTASTGNIQVTGTRTYNSAANYTYNGSSAQVTGDQLPSTVNNLTVNNSSGLTLTNSTSVNGTLTFTSGNILTGSNTLAVSSAGSVSRTSGHVVGNFKKSVATGATSRTFEIGDGSNYTPVSVSFGNVTVAGDLTGKTTSGDHPNIATSGIDATKSVNRYWSLTNSGITFNNYGATFTFVAGDVDGGATTGNFVVQKFDGSNWSSPTVGTRTATSTQITGETSFSDFAVGEMSSVPTITLTGSLNDFGTVAVGSTSSEQSYSVSGTNLTDNIAITAPQHFEISTTSGSGFTSSITLTHSGGTVNVTTIYVRFAPASSGAKSGNITHTSTGATTQNQAVTGTATLAPTIGLSGALNDFGKILTGTTSSEQSYSVSGANLTADLVVTAPAGFDISTTSGSGFGTSVTLTQSGGAVSSTTIYVRFAPASAGVYSVNITHTSTDATTQNQAVSGIALDLEPTVQASAIVFSNVGGSSMTLTWTNGNGGKRLVLGRSGSAVNANPVDGTIYTANTILGNGTQIGSGNYVVFAGTGNTVTVSGLGGSATFHFAVFEFNGSGGTENYLTTSPAVGNQTTTPATYSWSASGSSSWNTSSNWTPSRVFPVSTDILQFNAGSTVTVTGVPSQTISKLQVSNNTTVTLKATGANTLTINGGSSAFSVGAGSQLIVDSTNALTISVSAGSTGSVSGVVTFLNAAHKLIAADANGITFLNGAIYTSGTGFSGNPFGSGTANSVIFAGGSTFVFGAGSNPFSLTAPSSIVVFQTGSLYSHQTTGLPSVSNRTYANFEFKVPGGTVSPTGATAMTVDNLTVTDGTLNLNLNGGLNIKGNISVASGKILTFTPASAATINMNGSGTQTISGGGTLTFSTTANVVIGSSSTAVLDRELTVNGSLTVSGGLNCGPNVVTGSGSFTLNSGGTLTIGLVSGIVATGASGNIQVSGTRSFSTGANYVYNGSNAQVTGDGLPSSLNSFTINNASGITLSQDVAVNGTLTLSNGALTISSRTLAINGAIAISSGSLTGGSTSNITIGGSAGSATLPGITVNNLILNRSAGVILGGSTIVSGALTLTSGTLSGGNNLTLQAGVSIVRSQGSLSGAPSFDANHDVTYSATVTTGSELPTSSTALRHLTVNPGSSGTVTLNRDITVNGGLTLSSGTFQIGSNTLELKGSATGVGALSSSSGGEVVYAQASDGQVVHPAHYRNLTFNSYNKTLPSGGTVGVAGVFVPGSATGHTIAASTINFNGGNQTVPEFTYNNLTVSGSGTKTASSGIVVQGMLTISSVELSDGGNMVTVNGNIVNNGSHAGSGKIRLTGGSAAHNLTGSGTYQHLELDDSQGIALTSADIIINGSLTLTNGLVNTSNRKVVIGLNGTVAGANSTRYIFGTLTKTFAAGTHSHEFPIGNATDFAPVQIASAVVTTPGTISATTTAARHSDIVASGLDQSKSMERYWTLAGGGGIVVTSYDAIFTFVAGDLDPAATPNNFVVRAFDGLDWTPATTGARTMTSTEATALTSFGDFAIGEIALVGVPVALALDSGNNQIGRVGSELSNPFSILVTDAGGNPVQNARVRFNIVSAPSGSTGQALNAASVFTDVRGIAACRLTFGSRVGIYKVTASSTGLAGSPITLTATALAGGATSIKASSGGDQTGIVRSFLPILFIVKITDRFGNEVENAPVSFAITSFPLGATGQSLSVTKTNSADDGLAATTLAFGTRAGIYVVTATCSATEELSVAFAATATIGPAKSITLHSGDNQSGSVGSVLTSPLQIAVVDTGGNGVLGVSVEFTFASVPVDASGHSLTVTNVKTNSDGQASTVLRLGNKVGPYVVTAQSVGLERSPVSFRAAAVAAAPTTLKFLAGNNQIGITNASLPDPFLVLVTDSDGNLVQGIPVTFAFGSVPDGATGHQLSVTNATTNAQGQASTVLTLGNKEGVYAVTASVQGLAGSPVLFLAVALTLTSVERIEVVPTEFQLYQNYPNPFNPSTEIQFDVKEDGLVRLSVQDLAGRMSDILIDGLEFSAGRYRIRWDGAGRPSGVYLLRLIVQPGGGQAPFMAARKMLLLK